MVTGTHGGEQMNTHQKTNTATGSAQEGATVRYTAKTHTSGGRRGDVSSSDDGRLDVKFSAPGLPGTGTNPEQLFAAGWSACFISAMGLVANKMKIKLPADVAMLCRCKQHSRCPSTYRAAERVLSGRRAATCSHGELGTEYLPGF